MRGGKTEIARKFIERAVSEGQRVLVFMGGMKFVVGPEDRADHSDEGKADDAR